MSRILVLGGVNGAGKSSVLGWSLERAGGAFFDPDKAARALRERHLAIDSREANARAWREGRAHLEAIVRGRGELAIETTLGGRSIRNLLDAALLKGVAVWVRYVGLDGPELHLARVRARVRAGGHDIPEHMIRERYRTSRENLLHLMPRLTDLVVYDNTIDRIDLRALPPVAVHVALGHARYIAPLATVREWAKPIAAAAMRLPGAKLALRRGQRVADRND
jgi:predicted ABC-type ATPase